MEIIEDVVIVGAGIAGLTTSLGLHRLGIRSLVLESSDKLRVEGFVFTTWANAWKALDAVGIGNSLRQHHEQLQGIVIASTNSGLPPIERSLKTKGKYGNHESRCVQRNLLLETLASELPSGTIRFSSKVVSIEKSGHFKLVHLVDGTVYKTKILIGCDGINSIVGKWLGFKKPMFTGRSAIRGCADFKGGHGFEPKLLQFFGKGYRSGLLSCDDKTMYWFFTWTPSNQDKELEENPAKMKQFVLKRLENLPDQPKVVLENTSADSIILSPIRHRHPWEVLWGNITKDNVCVAGDALHPMTPDIGQGGCSALEDGVVLARCLGEALAKKPSGESSKENGNEGDEEYKRIERGLKKYAKERKWRSFELISTSYMVGFVQQGDWKIMNFLRNRVLTGFLAGLLMKRADFDCGQLAST